MQTKIAILSSVILPILTSVAAIVAWIAKLRWSREYQLLSEKRMEAVQTGAAERIAVAEGRVAAAEKHAEYLEREIRNLAEFAPSKIREHFETMRALDQQRIVELEALLQRTQKDVATKEAELQELRDASNLDRERVNQLEEYLTISRQQITYLEEQLENLARRDDELASVQQIVERPDFPEEAVRAYMSKLDADKRWATSQAKVNLQRARAQTAERTRRVVEAYQERKDRAEQTKKAANHLKLDLPDHS